MDHILSIVLFTPLAGMLVLLLVPSTNARAIRLWANAAGLLGFLVSLPLVFGFDPAKDYQFVERAPWIPTLGATYHIGTDGLGLLLVMLTTLLGFVSILSSWNAIQERLKEYYALFLLLQTAMLSCRSISCCSSSSGKPCWSPCTSSLPSGAARAVPTRPSSSSSIP